MSTNSFIVVDLWSFTQSWKQQEGGIILCYSYHTQTQKKLLCIQISGTGRIVHLISGAIRLRPDFKNCYPVHLRYFKWPWILKHSKHPWVVFENEKKTIKVWSHLIIRCIFMSWVYIVYSIVFLSCLMAPPFKCQLKWSCFSKFIMTIGHYFNCYMDFVRIN